MSNNTKSRNVLVSSGNVLITTISEPNGDYCGYPQLTPTITIKNASDFVVTSITATYTCGDLSAEKTFEVSIASGTTATLAFDPVTIPEGEGSISFVVTSVNGGENETQTPKTANFNVKSHNGEGFRLSLTADYNGTETSWEIKDSHNNVIYSGNAGEYTGTPVITDFCLGAGCYTFTLKDRGGNGLNGFYGWFYMGDASFTNLNTNETLLSVDGSESFSTKTINFCVDGPTEIEFEPATEMSIYPNPTNGMLNITSNEEIDSVEIFNSVGTAVISSTVAGNSSSIDMSNLPNGMYFVRVYTANGIETVKVVLER